MVIKSSDRILNDCKNYLPWYFGTGRKGVHLNYPAEVNDFGELCIMQQKEITFFRSSSLDLAPMLAKIRRYIRRGRRKF